jgi:hypothetical protein
MEQHLKLWIKGRRGPPRPSPTLPLPSVLFVIWHKEFSVRLVSSWYDLCSYCGKEEGKRSKGNEHLQTCSSEPSAAHYLLNLTLTPSLWNSNPIFFCCRLYSSNSFSHCCQITPAWTILKKKKKKKTPLLWYNSHTVQFIHLKCSILLSFCIFIDLCNHHQSQFQTLLPLQKETLGL